MNINDINYIILTPCVESYPFEEKLIQLPLYESLPIIVGRNIGNITSSKDNAIFHCKVLSRNHASIWIEDNKCYICDTKSSNGTYVNGVKLQSQNKKNLKKQLFTGDILQFGVEIIDYENKVISPCIIAYVKFANKFGQEIEVNPKCEIKAIDNKMTLCEDRISNFTKSKKDSQKIFELQEFIKEIVFRESILTQKLEALEEALLSTSKTAESSWTASVNEKNLLSRIQRLECKMVSYENKYPSDPYQKFSSNDNKENIEETINEICKNQKEFENKVDKEFDEYNKKISNLNKTITVINNKLCQQERKLDENEIKYKLNNNNIEDTNTHFIDNSTLFEMHKKTTDYKIPEVSNGNINNYKNDFKNHLVENKICFNFDETESQCESASSIILCHFQQQKNDEYSQYESKNQQYQQKPQSEISKFSDESSCSLSPYFRYKYLKKPKKKSFVYNFNSICEGSLLTLLKKNNKKRQKKSRKRKLKLRKLNKKTNYYENTRLNKNTMNYDFSFDILFATLFPLVAIFTTILIKLF
uniref:FHA domain-containing protein n=1 Tax=Strongyloides stercoralis TaxID=6248 RepID=A0A0K0EH68_STRER